MAKKPANKGKKCIRKKRVNGKLKCASFGVPKAASAPKRRRKRAA